MVSNTDPQESHLGPVSPTLSTSSQPSIVSFTQPRSPPPDLDSEEEDQHSSSGFIIPSSPSQSRPHSPLQSHIGIHPTDSNSLYMMPDPSSSSNNPLDSPPPQPALQTGAASHSPQPTQHNGHGNIGFGVPTVERSNKNLFDLPAAALPAPYAKEAPATFKGSYSKVEDFINHYERLLVKYNIEDGDEQCEGLLVYCSAKVRRTIRSLRSFKSGRWQELKKDILKLYDADRARNRYQPSDLQALALSQSNQPIDNLSQWLSIQHISGLGYNYSYEIFWN